MPDITKDILVDRQAFKHIATLIAIALVIGIYLIFTTVLISRDGVFYIERAQKLSSDPAEVIRSHPPGYPFMIFATHKAISFFTHDNSNQAWIYSAQIVTLLCRLLALIPLYFIGKLLVGSKNSFLALLILILLPYPTKVVCDAVREWPYLLFLSTGFFFLLWSAKYKKWWAFSIVGFSCGLGYLIRPESVQLMIFGLLWAGVSFFRTKMWGLKRWKVIAAAGLLLFGFAIPAVPYTNYSGHVLPAQVKYVRKAVSLNQTPESVTIPKANSYESAINAAEVVPGNVLDGLGEIFTSLGENLMWFFVLPLASGLYCTFRGNVKKEEKFLVTIFIMSSISFMLLRFCYIEAHISQRWTLALVVLTIFYIPAGLQIMGTCLTNVNSREQKAAAFAKYRFSWFGVFFLIGIGICMPKLLRPVGADKYGYFQSAKWLSENAEADAVLAVPDNRIGFYSGREYVVVEIEEPDESVKWDYYVEILKGDNRLGEVSYWVDRRRKNKRLVVHQN